MGIVPEYTRRASRKYDEKFDRILSRVPKGTKERIAEVTDMSPAMFGKVAIMQMLEAWEQRQQSYKEGKNE